jgi:hypothetical protein
VDGIVFDHFLIKDRGKEHQRLGWGYELTHFSPKPNS